ncbi:GNAT family N-acetyltransferase [Sinomicrobium sp. M5D2P17]
MTISNSTINDIDDIFRLYKIASDYQKAKKEVTVWPDFERGLIENEISENRQWKMTINGEIACIWAITFSDAQIWQKRNEDSAVYIHRIATNPDFRGNNFVTKIVDWAKEYTIAIGKQYVRMDTTGNNARLIEHYKNSGFDFLGMFELEDTKGLPEHYHKAPVCLFEINLKN